LSGHSAHIAQYIGQLKSTGSGHSIK
jgi:hypothetical protein